jgi:pimeloyl-ACP methyl ester carboxylesterase
VETFTETIAGQGLSLSVHRFRDRRAQPNGKTILLLHGFLDSGATWDRVGAELAQSGAAIYAPDMRGFGKSDRVGSGGYYHFPDYVADLAALVEHIAPAELLLVGHSMGGTVACLYAGACPDRVHKLVLLEGVGPPAMAPSDALTRTRRWLEELRSRKGLRPLASLEDATQRLAATHPGIDREVLASRAPLLTIAGDDGSLAWAHDPLHRTTSPSTFQIEALKAFLAEIRCPVTFVSGGETGWHPADEADRLASFPTLPRTIELEGAGHMMHWTRPVEVARAILEA